VIICESQELEGDEGRENGKEKEYLGWEHQTGRKGNM